VRRGRAVLFQAMPMRRSVALSGTASGNSVSGTYTSSVTLNLTSNAPGATIRYKVSTSGTPPADPGTGDTLYTGPVELTNSQILKARAWHPETHLGRK
jgi:hypothetical protein